jgi:uncharacterized protein YqcC (DUF446 family)
MMQLSLREQRSADLLLQIEAEMRAIGLWQVVAPSDEALSSPLPFCHDTLSFPQWLQFIFLPRMKVLLEAGAALPDRCGIAPMAEESFRFVGLNTAGLLALLRLMDETLGRADD